MTSASLRELVVRSPDPGRLDAWYREALAVDGPPRRLHLGGAAVRFELDRTRGARAQEPARLLPNLVVGDAGDVERRLVCLGATWIRELEATAWGRIATVVDPDGNYVQVFEVERSPS